MLERVSSIVGYINWLLEKQKEVQQHSILRIIDIKTNKTGKSILTIQVANKSTTFQCDPVDILSKDSILEGFSKQDVRTITYLATQDINKPKTKIISHRFLNGFKKIIFKVKNKNDEHVEERSLSEIKKNKSIKDFDSEDAHLIGYLSAMEQSMLEHEYLENKT